MQDFGWAYPPGVTGGEPHLTGAYPCVLCEGVGGEPDEEGGFARCSHCLGSGLEPEEFSVAYIEELCTDECPYPDVIASVLGWVRTRRYDRTNPSQRRELHAAAMLRRLERS